MTRLSLVLVFFLLTGIVPARQSDHYTVSGKVVDAETRQPLAFVNILVNDGPRGGTTDIDGVFRFTSPDPVLYLRLSYVGYEPLVIAIDNGSKEDLLIKMTVKEIDLPEIVIIPGINPAHRIIKRVIENRDLNDPEKISSFSYTAYDRTVITAEIDSLAMEKDTTGVDSSFLRAKEFFNKQDIALMESVVERKFMAPDRNYENVIANRVSGFQDPVFLFLLSQLQSTTFYKPMFHILDKHYVNPISKGSTEKYYFKIEDTTFTERKDTVFIISFRPLLNTNFDGMKGLLYINSYRWAIQNVIAEPTRMEGISVKVQQMYELVDSTQWFPVQLNTDIIFNNAMVQAGEAKMKIVGIGKSYIRDIVLNPERIRREMDLLGIDVEPDAHDKEEGYWSSYRVDSLSERDKRTYEFMDSLGREVNLDRFAMGVETLMSGKIPLKWVDIDLDKIINYNSYQGLYLGLGLHTSERFSRKVRLGGYWGYGFKDKSAKYGGDVMWTIDRRRDIRLRAEYFFDLSETGGTGLMFDDRKLLHGDNWRQLLLKRMNQTEQLAAGFSFRLLRDLQLGFELRSSTKEASDDYRYAISNGDLLILRDRFDFTEAIMGMRFAFREEFLVTRRSRVSLGSRYPVIWLQYTRGISGFLEGEYEYDRIDLKVEKSFYVRYLGKSTFVLKGGYIRGDVPYCNLYNGNGSYRDFTIFAPQSFATMRMNEFLSDRYVSLYWEHNFGKLIVRKEKFSPEFVVLTNVGYGWLEDPGSHYNVEYKTMENGYFESGFLVNNLLDLGVYSIGVGAFYRYGPQSYASFIDNAAFKFSIVFPFTD